MGKHQGGAFECDLGSLLGGDSMPTEELHGPGADTGTRHEKHQEAEANGGRLQ